jgi:hypothetical protein
MMKCETPISASLRDLCGFAVNSSHLVAEYALSGIGKPIGIAEYQLVRAPPANSPSTSDTRFCGLTDCREILSFGKAAELSRLSQFRFGHDLAGRGIARHDAEEYIAEDFAYAGGQ